MSKPGSQYDFSEVLYYRFGKGNVPIELVKPSRDGQVSRDSADGRFTLVKHMQFSIAEMKALGDAFAAGTITSADVLTPEEARALLPKEEER